MRLIRRFFVTITAAFIMFSAGHTASNAAADRYYTANKPGSDNITCQLTYELCYEGYYLENGMCIECPHNFDYFESIDDTIKLHKGGKTSCKIKLEPGEYYSVARKRILTCPAGYYCEGGVQYYDENNKNIGRFDCPAGSFCPEKSVKPTPCEAGYYCPKTKQSDKTTAQLECGTGNYCEAGSKQQTSCPDVPSSTSVNNWLPDVITDNKICDTAINTITHKKEPEFVSYHTTAGAVTECQIKLEVEIPCGLVHIYRLQYDSNKHTYSNTEKLTSYYISLNQGYYLYEQLYDDDKCTNADTSDDALPLYYSKAAQCTKENISYCDGLHRMPLNCDETNNKYPYEFGIFTCAPGQYKLDTPGSNTIFPTFDDCPIGSYCEECEKNPCPSSYYCPAKKLTATTYQNYKCPTGATSKAGSDEITDCYLNNTTIFQDNNGKFNLPMKNIYIIQQ